MKNKLVLFLIAVLILGAGIFVFVGGSAGINENTGNSNGEVQVVKLSVVGGTYVMNPSEVKQGIPVRIEADMSKMPGCSKSIVISAFNVRKTFTSQSNTVEFTPDKAGTFNIACSMNMYRGSFVVLENDGSKSNYVDTSAPSGGSCGGSSGGCGCGG